MFWRKSVGCTLHLLFLCLGLNLTLGLLNYHVLNLFKSTDVAHLFLSASMIEQDGLNLAGRGLLHGKAAECHLWNRVLNASSKPSNNPTAFSPFAK
jgi:hypothetical protein